MEFLLDTCVLSDFAKGDPATKAHLERVAPLDIAVSTVTEMEILYGLSLHPGFRARLGPIMQQFFGAVRIVPFDSAAARVAANLRAMLKRRGTPIGAYDALIAGIALANDLILVTSNVREFQLIAGLRIKNWRT